MALSDGLILQHNMEDTSADAGSIDFSQAGTGTISFVSDGGRDAVKLDANLHGSLHLASDLDLGAGGWTLSTWFKNIRPAGTNHNGTRELFHWWSGSMSGPWARFCAVNSAGEIFNTDGTSTNRTVAGYNIDTNINDSSWHLMTVVYDGSSEISYYIDGSYVGKTSGWNGHSLLHEINGAPDNAWFQSNVDSGGYKRAFAEYISDVRAWNRDLSSAEVSELFSAGLDVGMVAKYALDSDASDSVGSNDGTVGSSTFETVGSRTLIKYSSNTDYVTIPYSESLLPLQNLSVSTWVKFDEVDNNYDFLISANGKSNATPCSYQLYRNRSAASDGNGNKIVWRVVTSGGMVTTVGPTVTSGQWYHIAGTYDGSTIRLYIDGVEVANAAQSGDMIRTANEPIYLNYQNVGTANWSSSTIVGGQMRGAQDDTRIWSRALSALEISLLHTESKQLTDNQVAQYALDSDLVDSVGSNDGTVSGASFGSISGRDALSFDGVDDFVQIPDPAALSGDTWAISQWIKTSNASGRQDFFAKWYSSNGNYASIGLGTDGGLLKAYYRGDNQGSVNIMTGPNVSDDAWHHIAYVKDSSTVRIYVDGAEVAQAAFSGVIPSTSDVFLGVWEGSILGYAKDHWFDGSLGDLRIWSRALSAGEVSELYAEPVVPESSGEALIDITYSGQLSGVRAFDHNGSVFCYITEESEAPSVYFGTDLGDFASFEKKTMVFGGAQGDDWIQVPAYPTMPTINADGSLSFFYSSHVMARKESNVSAGDFEIVVEFDNNNTSSGDFGMSLIDGSNIVVFRQQAYNAWGANNSFFFGLWNGSSYLASGAGPAQLASGAMKIAREGTIYKFYSSSDKVSFTEMGQFDAAALGWVPGDLELRVQAGSRSSVDVTGFSRNDLPSQPTSLEGKPMSLSMKSDDGSIYLGTRSGKLYHIAYDAGSSCVAKELFSGSGEVTKVHWDSHRSECLFEVDGVIRSVDLSDTVSVKHTLAAGSIVEDFKAAPSGVAIVFRKVDFTFEVMFIEGTNWASPKASSQMIESVRAAKDFEYNSDLDMWVAATDDGQTSVGDLL